MDAHDLVAAWVNEIDLAETLLPDDPMDAQDILRSVTEEIESFLPDPEDARDPLALLLARARAALACSRTASARWQAGNAERSRQSRAREFALTSLPMQALRSPWPPRVSG